MAGDEEVAGPPLRPARSFEPLTPVWIAMHKRLPIRRSFAAQTSRWTGVVSVPVLLIGGLLHRMEFLDTPTLYTVLAAGFVLALVAVLTGVGALSMIWQNGGLGTSEALRGIIYGGIALTPALLATYAVVQYPRLNDVSTDVADPPRLLRPIDASGGNAPADDAGRKAGFELQRAAYPDIVPRRFPIGTAELDAAVRQVLADRGWTIVRDLKPAMNDDSAQMWIEARTLFVGFVDDMTIRIRPDRIGSRLDLRSASRYGVHDLGANARRIRSFLESLDTVLTEAYGTLEPPEEDAAPDDTEAPDEPGVPMPAAKPNAVSG
ncbi:DUF1499 domain-containing protein [Breoghania sp. L-A4]|uniref:DUF1499 domain-containing protein n=1 Tax=Breoghania sp. L-A4 TaxID=2304600 RepID=UPI000E35910A|nr:DUF1499 domain-containing protein [Breoghania sp. L-A4]AXS39605.1 DUF1499 domain-containing protein [Breoghania sp. L-A4]